MRTYHQQLVGRCHDRSEDALYSKRIVSPTNQEFGLYLVADGLSGFGGSFASTAATAIIGRRIEDDLRKNHDSDCAEIVRSAIILGNELLQKRSSDTHTCLDLALISPQEVYLAHLGDSRVYFVYDHQIKKMTKDECREGIPTNYLGLALIGDKTIEERVTVQRFPREGLKYVFLATDGLFSRATETEIDVVLRKLPQQNAQAVLDEFTEIVDSPRKLLLTCSIPQIKGYYLAAIDDLHPPEGATKEQLINWILQKYQRREHDELVRRLDNGMDLGLLKYDDTTMILVDLEDAVGQGLEGAVNLEKSLGESVDTIAGLRQSMVSKEGEIKDKSDEIARLEEKSGELDRDLGVARQETESKRGEYNTLNEKYQQQTTALRDSETKLTNKQGDYQVLEKTLKEKEGEVTTITQEKTNLFTRCSGLEGQLAKARIDYDNKNSEVSSLRKELEKEKGNYSRLEEANIKLNARLTENASFDDELLAEVKNAIDANPTSTGSGDGEQIPVPLTGGTASADEVRKSTHLMGILGVDVHPAAGAYTLKQNPSDNYDARRK